MVQFGKIHHGDTENKIAAGSRQGKTGAWPTHCFYLFFFTVSHSLFLGFFAPFNYSCRHLFAFPPCLRASLVGFPKLYHYRIGITPSAGIAAGARTMAFISSAAPAPDVAPLHLHRSCFSDARPTAPPCRPNDAGRRCIR